MKWIKILVVLVLLCNFVKAQTGSQRLQYFKLKTDTLFLDSLSLVPGSLFISLNGKALDSTSYKLDPKKKFLIFNKKKLNAASSTDSIRVSYKVFPVNFEKNYFKKDIALLNRDQSLAQNPFTIHYNAQTVNSPIFQNDGLTKNGSVSRGISFGNNQDVVVNSNMNLQVSGKLSKELNLVLAATDNNIPIQPDGNTQQLQEFDKVFIQVNNEDSKITMGDFQLSRPQSYFLNFYKRTQGLLFENTFLIDSLDKNKPKLSTRLSGAISRGKFARNVIVGVENNQGPYRLKGADNELFIIVLSGTEKVYIDGKLIQRGQENEYIIDYNTSEITFTAKQIITKDKRITVEFQYSERNYNRSLYYVGEEYTNNKLKMGFHFFSEQDNKNKPFQQELSLEEKLLLRSIGDTLNLAVTDGAQTADFNTTEVFYRKQDTLTGSGTFSIYNYSIAPDTAYRVRFSYVGEGNGDYKQIQSLANGKVYQWYEPVGGIRQGNYEPVIVLVTPKKKQMAIVNGEYLLNAHSTGSGQGKISWEGAYTKNDINTFSPFNAKDDEGFGGKFNFSNQFKVGERDSLSETKTKILTGLSYEYLHKNFSQIERFRSVEFTRDWNRNSDSVKNMQHIGGAQLGFMHSNKARTLYTFNGFVEEGNYSGMRHILENNYNLGKLKIQFNPTFLSSNNSQNKNLTQFYRHKSRVTQQIRNFLLAYTDELENNTFNYENKDSILARSYGFWEREGSIESADSTGNSYKVFYRERTDKKATRNILKPVAYAQNYGASANINSIKNHPIRTTITYRQLKILDSTLISNTPDNTLLSRLEYSPRIMKGFIQSSLFYEIGYGLEQKKEYSYVQVAAGQGQYYWNDYNNNGIKELNEFEIAQYSDQAIFIKIFTPTNNYVKAAHNQFSGSFYLRPSVFVKPESKKLLKAIGRFSTQTVYRTDNKSLENENSMIYNPFDTRINDSLLITTNSLFRQALFFNQNSSVGGFDYNYQQNKSKQLLVNGLESRENEMHELRTRFNFTKSWGFFTTANYGNKRTYSVYLSTRNYLINYYEVEPKLVFQPNTSFRIATGYKRSEKQNAKEYGNQKATIDDILLEIKYNKLSKGSFTMRADYLVIAYNDSQNSPISFEMLNSLKPGQNITWTMQYQQNLNQYLQISFNYDGRKTPNSKIIHIGGAQVRAFF
ncbi:MAG: hypothetical protein Q8M29_00290 [Bacteroidota bacterium]|nr:hypothetical protein [Bacteroidota bacterium]